jgi:phosphatidylserine/phosphatidylglycerophosphate/cardiolipin synthase-like enzyme
MHRILFFLTLVIPLCSFSQNEQLSISEIHQDKLVFTWGKLKPDEVVLSYGLTKNLERGEVKGLEITGLSDATFYYVQAKTKSDLKYHESDIQLFSTKSKSTGNITVYFNQWVNNNASGIADAIHAPGFEDTIIAYIASAENTLDICNYNTGSLPIVNAINTAASSGVTVRYIAADETGTNNTELENLSATIPMIQRPDDGEIMHNKFIIIDAEDSQKAKIITGSMNHTDNSLHQDYNNMVIIQDQSLALAYKTEFEEMWGSTGNTPDEGNAKFGNAKTDNTPHNFNIGGVPVELYFSPSDGTTAKIEQAILSADTDMQFAMLTFIHNDLGDAVETIYNAGVDVKGIIENVYYFGSEYNSLVDAGVNVHSHFYESYFFHHKYAVVDANNVTSDPLVITGSHNWTNSAEEENDENTLIIHDAEIANMYFEEFMARYEDLTEIPEQGSFDKFSLDIYPNPCDNRVNLISAGIDQKIIRIFVLDVTGKIILDMKVEDSAVTLHLAELEKGPYFIKVETENAVFVERIIKN